MTRHEAKLVCGCQFTTIFQPAKFDIRMKPCAVHAFAPEAVRLLRRFGQGEDPVSLLAEVDQLLAAMEAHQV